LFVIIPIGRERAKCNTQRANNEVGEATTRPCPPQPPPYLHDAEFSKIEIWYEDGREVRALY